MVRALASHQCGPGSNPGVDAICGLSLLLVLSLAPRGFSPGTPVFPLLKNQHFQIPIRSGTHGHVSTSCYELLSAPWVNKLQLQICSFPFFNLILTNGLRDLHGLLVLVCQDPPPVPRQELMLKWKILCLRNVFYSNSV